MRMDILTLFPEMFAGFLEHSILGRARERERLDVRLIQWRDYAIDKHRVVDDAPYGGGAGMVLMCEPLFRALEDLRPAEATFPETQVVYLTPQGRPLDQDLARELADQAKHLILVCGRYEGVDYRARETLFDREVSVGDFVLTGGELPAAMLAEAVARHIPGVLGNASSAEHESHMEGLFDHPHYTRPEVFRGMATPQILLSGHHAKIEAWRRRQALWNTWQRRPDLLAKADLTPDEQRTIRKWNQEKPTKNPWPEE